MEEIIAPGSTNSYKFYKKNKKKCNMAYKISFEEVNPYDINIKYKLKYEGNYLIDHWVDYTELETESSLVNRLEKLQKEYDVRKKDMKYIKKTNKYLTELKALDKVYPKLKNKDLYKLLSSEMDTNQERIDYAMDTYDKEVAAYNNYISNEYIAKLKELFKFPDYDYYKRKK